MNPRVRIVWNLAMGLAERLHECSHRFPPEERYETARQLRRAAISVPANLAEGAARESAREFRRFLRISLGSLAEARTYVDFACRCGWLAAGEGAEFEEFFDRVRERLAGLIEEVERRMRREGVAK